MIFNYICIFFFKSSICWLCCHWEHSVSQTHRVCPGVHLLCRLRSIAARRDHFVLHLSVCLCVCPVVMHSYVLQATHAFLGILPLCYSYMSPIYNVYLFLLSIMSNLYYLLLVYYNEHPNGLRKKTDNQIQCNDLLWYTCLRWHIPQDLGEYCGWLYFLQIFVDWPKRLNLQGLKFMAI